MRKGWFEIAGVQRGDRTLEQQISGLEHLWPAVEGRTVLDLGCAEGLITQECARCGASLVCGIDVNGDALKTAHLHNRVQNVRFKQHDLNDGLDEPRYDVVLMLAVLHKLRDPERLLREVLATDPALVIVRLPPANAPVIIDARSGNRPCDTRAIAESMGFSLERVTHGHLSEWTGYFRADH